MGTLQRSATQAAKTSPAIAEPPIPIRKTRWASAIGARALPSAQIAAAEIWSGSDAMMSRIPPGSTRATRAYPVLAALSTEDIKYDRHSAFSISVNHRDTFTGVTDIDRAKTISRLAGIAKEATKRENGWAADVFANEFRSPGHVPLLNAAEPLLAERRGHTELTTALMIMAGLAPTATICEMMADDGQAVSKEDAKAYARARNLVFLEGQDIVRAWRSWSA